MGCSGVSVVLVSAESGIGKTDDYRLKTQYLQETIVSDGEEKQHKFLQNDPRSFKDIYVDKIRF